MIVTIWVIGAGIIAAVTIIGMFVAGKVGRRDTALRAPDPRFPHFDGGSRARRYGAGLMIGRSIGRALKRRKLLG